MRAATWASGDVLPSLSRRAAELEALAKSLQSDLDRAAARLAVYTELDAPLERALVDAYAGAQEIEQKARMEADSTLERAMDQRRLLMSDLDRLRGERDDITDEIAFARRGRFMPLRTTEPVRDPAPDHRGALAAEMRVMLLALLDAHFGERPGPAPPKTPAPEPKTPARAPRTLLRAPVAAPRKAHVAPPLDAKPTTFRPLRVPPALTPPLPVTTPTRDVIKTVPPATAVAAVVAPDASAMVMPSETQAVASTPQASPPTTGVAESPAIMASVDLVAATEPAAELIAEEETTTGEATTVELELDPRLIALQLADMSSTNAVNIEEEREPEAAIELPEPEPMPTVLELSDVVQVLQAAEAVDVAPTEVHEVPEQVISPSEPPVETEALTTVDPRPIDEMWETALETTEHAKMPETADASLAWPVEAITELAIIEAEPVISEPELMVEAQDAPDPTETLGPIVTESAVAPLRAARELQLVLSPITSFPQLLAIQQRIASLSSVNAIHLRDFRNGVATFAAGVTDALSGREFGSVLQMLTELQLRLEGATENRVELRVGPRAL